MLRSIGADRVVDYAREDFTRLGRTYDVIYDIVGNSSFSRCMAVLSDDGRYLLGNPRLLTRLRAPWVSRKGGKAVITGASRQSTADLLFLKQLVEAGRIRAVVDREFSLEDVPEAHRYVETGVVRGKVVIVVYEEATPGPPASPSPEFLTAVSSEPEVRP
jgi:NADPH:quinone reductase-like Zn-dependent oxidoreductase